LLRRRLSLRLGAEEPRPEPRHAAPSHPTGLHEPQRLQPPLDLLRGCRKAHAGHHRGQRARGAGPRDRPLSGRGYNIESLTVAETDHQGHLSRITIVTTGTPQIIDQIEAQLGRIVQVREVHDLTVEGAAVERELALLKVAGTGEHRVEALRLADIFRAKVVDSTLGSFVFEITGTSEKVDAFADLMRPWAFSRSRGPASRRFRAGPKADPATAR
jgi:acetolactate synthase small subunit